jgi:DNA-binding LacI/PurR family transcriptional regulator
MVHKRVRPTIRDVAKEAGVSMTTVSHSLNGKGIVADATRSEVVKTAHRLGYRPHAVASGLRNNRLGVIALVMRPLDTLESFLPEGVDYFLRFAGAASLSALEHGYGLMLLSDPTLPQTPGIALAADGFIIADPVENDPVIDLLQAEGIPLLTAGKDVARGDYEGWIETNTSVITEQVLDHLAENGATRIALARGTDRNSWNVDTEDTYRRWCDNHCQPAIIMAQRETSGQVGGQAFAEEILSMATPPDGVYCLTGRHAAGMALGLKDKGARIPDDIRVVAGSDSEQTRNSNPPISAVDLEPEALAREAVGALINQLNAKPRDGLTKSFRAAGRFIVRGSSVPSG